MEKEGTEDSNESVLTMQKSMTMRSAATDYNGITLPESIS